MAAGTYNFILEQGATFTRTLTVKENNSAMNLTGYSVASKMRSTHDSVRWLALLRVRLVMLPVEK